MSLMLGQMLLLYKFLTSDYLSVCEKDPVYLSTTKYISRALLTIIVR